MIREKFNWKDLLIVLTFSFFFLFLCKIFFAFTLDDAYILFRYSKNLATGRGLVWNVGEDPVEGYSSFLWMILIAISIKVGINPVYASKIISIIASLCIICILYLYSISRTDNRIIPVLGVAGVAINPAFAYLTVQGMDTILAAFFVLCSIILSIRLVCKYSKIETAILGILLFLAFLTRPDLFAFIFGLLVGMLIIINFQHNKNIFLNFVFILLFFLVIPGIIYMAWRLFYFGYFFPNTFYVKRGLIKGILPLSLDGISNVFHYHTEIIGLYFILTLYSFISNKSKNKKEYLKEAFPALISFLFFFALHCSIHPIQGKFYRFQMPTFPSFLLLFSLYVPSFTIPKLEFDIKSIKQQINDIKLLKSFIILLFCFLFMVFPLLTMEDAINEKDYRQQADKILIGKELAKLADKDYIMFTTESGALPYYSDWKTIDDLGLNNEYIAHNGLSLEYLEKIMPDLVMILLRYNIPGDLRIRYPVIYNFMKENNYTFITAPKRNEDHSHFYFVKFGNSSLEIVELLLNNPNIVYIEEFRDIRIIIGNEIPIWKENRLFTEGRE